MASLAPEDTGIDVVNAPKDVWGDVYHQLLRAPWSLTLLAIAGMVLAIDVLFALAFLLTGGIAVTVESIASLVAVALATGIVFTKFSIPVARLEFARGVAIYLQDGVRTLAIRLANRRRNFIVEAQVRVTFIRAETTKEGIFFYRLYDLPLVRDRSSALGRSWLVLHRIIEGSPLENMTPESLRTADVELNVAVSGIDGTTYQTMHALHRYMPEDFRFGERFADMLSPKPDGRIELDYTRLHDTVRATY